MRGRTRGRLRPNGCNSRLGAGARRREERRKRRRGRPGQGRGGGTPRSLRCAGSALLPASESYTKGLRSPSHRRPRGTAGSTQQGGAVASPAPGPAPAPPRSHRPLRGCPHLFLCIRHLPFRGSPHSHPCVPTPTPSPWWRWLLHAAPVLGTGNPQGARINCAL